MEIEICEPMDRNRKKGLGLRVDACDSYRSCNLSRKGLITLTVQTNYWG